MSELYNLISSCNPNRQVLILTALEGEPIGEKALFIDGILQWESKENGFFSHITASSGCFRSRHYQRRRHPDLLRISST